MLDTPRDRQSYPLDKDFEIGDLTFDIVGRFTDTSTGTYTVGQQIFGFSLDQSTSLQENAYINVSSNPTEIDATRGVYRYTIAAAANRGLDSNQTTSSSLNSQVSNQKRHQAGREVGIVNSCIYQAELHTEFTDNVANRFAQFFCFDATTDVTVGDGRSYFQVPAKFTGNNLTIANATVLTAGTTGSTTIQIHNVTDGVDMLSTPITILSGATTGSGVIDATKDDVVTGDILRVDIKTASATPPKGLLTNTEFQN